MARGRSKKPCAGCGKLPDFDRSGERWTDLKPICYECRGTVREHKKLAALVEKRLKGELKAVNLPANDDRIWRSSDRAFGKASFKDAFQVFCRILGVPCVNMSEERLLDGQQLSYDPGNTLAFEPEVVQALRALFAAVRNLSEKAYQEGLERGADLLQDLIKGERTAQDINEVVVRKNKG